jgi:phosphatidylglycerophosphatase A
MWTKFLVNVGTLWGIGRVRFMPGTVGSFLGAVFSYFLFKTFGNCMILAICIGMVMFAIYACSAAERAIGRRDPSCVIFDEFVAMPLCFLFLGHRRAAVFLLGFLIFRIFDLLKPLGIKIFEKFHGGLGIVLDDVAAACYTNAILHLLLCRVKCCAWSNF